MNGEKGSGDKLEEVKQIKSGSQGGSVPPSNKRTTPGGLGSSQTSRRKTSSQNGQNKLGNQFLTNPNQNGQPVGGVSTATNSDIMQLMKKREKMNNSALDKIGADPGRKFTTQASTPGSNMFQSGPH